MSLSLFTNWAVGVINGYKKKDNGLPANIKYSTLGITTTIGIFKTMANWDTPSAKNVISSTLTPRQKVGGLLIGVPLAMGMNFCVGHHMGKAIRWAKDDSDSIRIIINKIDPLH